MDFSQIYQLASPFTMTSPKKMAALNKAVIYVNENNIQGSLVECGVFKGGSVMNMALTQLNYPTLRHIYLYDTFEGMTPEGELDINHRGIPATTILKKPSKKCIASLEEVQQNLTLTGYPKEFLHFIKGDVAQTLKQTLPNKIAVLRLDTDWYESTKIEMEQLYPRLAKGGVLILDDYGYWKGARIAVDNYFASLGIKPHLQPMDEGISGVIYIKEQ